MKIDLSTWPVIKRPEALAALQTVPLAEYPDLAGYDRAAVHDGLAGQGGLFLAADMARLMKLSPGMRVLDLGCGEGATSVFLAKRYGVVCHAVDRKIADSLKTRAQAAGVKDRVISVRADARDLPFAEGEFDAVFCMNAFFYFGTDDLYPSYLLRFLKPGGEICIGGPCYADEIYEGMPEEFLLEFPACLAVHSPVWWRRHFERAGQAKVTHAELHPRGRQFWEDRFHFLLEQQSPAEMEPWKQKMVLASLRMMNRDEHGFISHFMLHALKVRPNQR